MIIPRFKLSVTGSDLGEFRKNLRIERPDENLVIERFEADFSGYTGRKFAVFLPSARVGLYKILKRLPFQKGGGIIVPAWTHPSVPSMIVSAGFKPLFADIEPKTYNISGKTIPSEHLKSAKAIIITHLYGCPAPLGELLEIARKNNLYIIEDCAQSLGAEFEGKKTGSFGDASIFSLSITKNLTTITGGIVSTDDPNLYKELKDGVSTTPANVQNLAKTAGTAKAASIFTNPKIFSLFVYPPLLAAVSAGFDPVHDKFKEPVKIETPPEKTPPPHYSQAMLGIEQLKTLDSRNKSRNDNGRLLLEMLKGIKDVILPKIPENSLHIFMSFVLMAENPWKLKKSLLSKGIDTSPGYLLNNASHPAFREFGADMETAGKLEKTQIHIPIYQGLSEKDIERIANAIKNANAR